MPKGKSIMERRSAVGKSGGKPRFFLANGRRDPLAAEADLTAVR
jgi:hypothetical protein